MKRIDIRYGGEVYSVGGRDVDDLQAEIDAAVENGGSGWIVVNHGEGTPQEARLLLGPGVPISLLPIADPE